MQGTWITYHNEKLNEICEYHPKLIFTLEHEIHPLGYENYQKKVGYESTFKI